MNNTFTSVEAIDKFNLIGRQFKIENGYILFDTCYIHGFW